MANSRISSSPRLFCSRPLQAAPPAAQKQCEGGIVLQARCSPSPSCLGHSGLRRPKWGARFYSVEPKLKFLGRFQDCTVKSVSSSELERKARDFVVSFAKRVASALGVDYERASCLQTRELLMLRDLRAMWSSVPASWERDLHQWHSWYYFLPKEPRLRMSLLLEACRNPTILQRLPSVSMIAGAAIRCKDAAIPYKDGVLWHPQELDQWQWIVFQPGSGREVAVELKGAWTRRDKVMIGFVQQEAVAGAKSSKHPADVGYFISLGSGSVMGPDGTNYFLGDTVEDVWLKQLLADGFKEPPHSMESCFTMLRYRRSGLMVCLQLVANFQLHLWVCLEPSAARRSWTKLCVVQWGRGPSLPEGNWCPAIAFLPRKSMGLPQCAVTRPCARRGTRGGKGGGGKGSRRRAPPTIQSRFLSSPGLVLLSTNGDTFGDCPRYIDGRVRWPPTDVNRVNAFKSWLSEGLGRNMRHLVA